MSEHEENEASNTSRSRTDKKKTGIHKLRWRQVPQRQIFCPDYYMFYADTELGLYAKSLQRFHWEKKVGAQDLVPPSRSRGEWT